LRYIIKNVCNLSWVVMDKSILVIDDEKDIQLLIKEILSREGYDVLCASTGEDAIALLKSYLPDLILLDLLLPGMSGLEVCKALKENSKTTNIPIIMLTTKGSEDDIVTGLEFGADDYVVKSAGHKVLSARIKTALRKKHTTMADNSNIIKIDDLIIDTKKFKAFIMDKPLPLNQTEFKILSFLASKPGCIFSREQIINSVKEDDYFSSERYIDTLITSLRKKLGTYSKYIKTVHGIGYSLEE
jgi:two-component system, OmpR family, alkaline phosphatase synthesis response regulator PhoP